MISSTTKNKKEKEINIRLPFKEDVEGHIRENYSHQGPFKIISKSLDARGAHKDRPPHFIYRILLTEDNGSLDQLLDIEKVKFTGPPPIIVGLGPAGIFCALRLLEHGVPSIILERGDPLQIRMKKMAKFFKTGVIDPDSNVSYGEGGAGLFSDGKLITRVKSPYINYVLNKLVQFGGPEEILYYKEAHLGSNKIRKIIKNISSYLKESGVQILYNSKVVSFTTTKGAISGVVLENNKKIESSQVVLATGHSSKEIYQYLYNINVEMKFKNTAMGVRIEHPRKLIDKLQYGLYAGDPLLGSASYRLTYKNQKSGRSVYSFCMCPGGFVLSSGPDQQGIVTNGMSNYKRNSPWSNSGLIVSVNHLDYKSSNLIKALDFQREIEHRAYKLSANKRSIPAISLIDFLERPKNPIQKIKTSALSGATICSLEDIFPPFINQHLREALYNFDKKIKGFIDKEASILAPETRTSAPLAIVRDKKTLMSTSLEGLFPCGEGAGHAGGITSSAVDGVKVAESLIRL